MMVQFLHKMRYIGNNYQKSEFAKKFLERLRYAASASYEELKEKLFKKPQNLH